MISKKSYHQGLIGFLLVFFNSNYVDVEDYRSEKISFENRRIYG